MSLRIWTLVGLLLLVGFGATLYFVMPQDLTEPIGAKGLITLFGTSTGLVVLLDCLCCGWLRK